MAEPIRYRIAKKQQPGPHGLWQINRPDLGFVGEGYLFEVLYRKVVDWRRANGWPVGLGLEEELECALCEQYKDFPGACITDDPRAPIKPRALNYKDVLLGTQVMLSVIKARVTGQSPLVSPQEAERRALICRNCPLNVPFSKPCGGICSELKTLVESLSGHATTPYDADLNSCFICGCFLSTAVWIDAKLQTDPLPEFQRKRFEQVKSYCWKAQAL